MFSARTVFVVGAGSSCEAKFPDGATLLGQIMSALDIRIDAGQRSRGDAQIVNAILDFSERSFNQEFVAYQDAAWRIRDAAKIGVSIDNIIEQHDDSERIAVIGKIAIVRTILQAERNSLLSIDPNKGDFLDPVDLRDTWYSRLTQVLTEGIARRNVQSIFDRVGFICFNYDRAIEHFLPHGLRAAYGLPFEETRALVKDRLRIIHPYGQIAPLPWMGAHGGVDFGETAAQPLGALARNIKTFGERIEDETTLAAIRKMVGKAEQVVFLGFAFHRQNMDLIRPEGTAAQRVLATLYKVPKNEQFQIARDIHRMFQKPGEGGLIMHEGTCASLFSDNRRTLLS